jgi:hypothetical protein
MVKPGWVASQVGRSLNSVYRFSISEASRYGDQPTTKSPATMTVSGSPWLWNVTLGH